jgi:hypothetical protein
VQPCGQDGPALFFRKEKIEAASLRYPERLVATATQRQRNNGNTTMPWLASQMAFADTRARCRLAVNERRQKTDQEILTNLLR